MQKLICDVCGGKIQIQAGGQEGVCENCGVSYSMARLREILNGVEVSRTSPAEDVQRWRKLAKKYYDALSFVDAENVVKKILEACPEDPAANQTYEELQVLKYLDICNGVVRSYSGSAKRISIPQGISELSINVFENDPYLEELIVPEGVKIIKDDYYEGPLYSSSRESSNPWKQHSSLRRVVLPSTLEVIGEGTFFGCYALEDISIPAVRKIGVRAFKNCSSLKQLSIPEGLEMIDVEVFAGCSSLTEMALPNGVKSIGDDAFSGCSSLTEMVLPNGVKSIGHDAFSRCSSLKKLVIPESVTNIESSWYDFKRSNNARTLLCDSCRNLTDITYPKRFSIDLFWGTPVYDNYRKQLQQTRDQRLRSGRCPDCDVALRGVFRKQCPRCGRSF